MIEELAALGYLYDFKFKKERARDSITESRTLLCVS